MPAPAFARHQGKDDFHAQEFSCWPRRPPRLLSACGIGAPDYPEFSETSYRIEGTTASADGGAPAQTVIYRDGPKMRVETVLPNYGASDHRVR